DDFLTKYDTCVTSKLPEAQRATYKAQLDQTRKAWLDMAKNPSAKPAMEQSCKQTSDAMKASVQSFGCSFCCSHAGRKACAVHRPRSSEEAHAEAKNLAFSPPEHDPESMPTGD